MSETTSEEISAESTNAGLRLAVTFGQATFESAGAGPEVLAAFAAFRDFYDSNAPTLTAPPKVEDSRTNSGDGANGSTGSDEAAVDNRDPKDFVPLSVFLSRKKMPRGNKLIVLGIVVWAQAFKGDTVFTSETIRAYWRDSKKKMPGNLNRDIGEAATEGWLERLATGAGNYALTSYGEAHFNGLPKADE